MASPPQSVVLLTAPVDFNKSLVLVAPDKRLGNRLAVFYMKK